MDKSVKIGKRARVGARPAKDAEPVAEENSGITTIGKNAEIPDGAVVPRGSVVHTDVTADGFVPRPRKTSPDQATA